MEYASSLDLNELVIDHPAATFFMRVVVSKYGLRSGDLLVVDRSISPRSDSVLVVERDGDLAVERVRTLNEETVSWGVVTHVIRRFGRPL